MENGTMDVKMYREIMGEETIRNIDYSNPKHIQLK